MEHFTIDSQTFKDLDIFSEKGGSKSLFDLFKNTQTIAARERLKAIMQNPSNNLEEITRRSDSIKFFYDNGISLEIKNEEVDFIEFYLQSNFRKFKNNPLDTVADYLTRQSSNDYYVIQTSIKYLIKLTKYVVNFIQSHKSNHLPKQLSLIFEQIRDIVQTGVLVNVMQMSEVRISFLEVTRLDRALRGNERENMKVFLHLVYELDVFQNIAEVAFANGFCFPILNDKADLKISINGLFHPVMVNPVKNDLYIDNEKNIIFLTGSNMAGKSTLLKSLGLIIYLSHLGFPVPADSMETSVLNGLVTTINLSDNINQALSHFYSEVKRVKEVSESLLRRDKIFVIFDELFRGTNVKDAFDGSSLIISELAAIKNSVFIISTHIIELASVLSKFNNISFLYLDVYFQNKKPIFTYLIKEGVSKEVLGMYIIRNEGIVEILQLAVKNNRL